MSQGTLQKVAIVEDQQRLIERRSYYYCLHVVKSIGLSLKEGARLEGDVTN